MRSEPEERLSPVVTRRKPYWALLVVGFVVIIFAYFYPQKDAPAPVQSADTETLKRVPPPAELVLPPAPDIPIAAVVAPPPLQEAPEEVALTLEISDQVLRVDLAEAGGSDLLKTTLLQENLVQRCAGVVDGFSRGQIPYKALPLKPPAEKFSIVTIENQSFINPESYHRYDGYAEAIAELNTATLVSTFNRFRPLLEQAYAGLGYRADEFDNAVIRALDRILATPELHEPIALRRKETIYLHANPELEALTAVQKLLLRTGPDNVARIKGQAQAIRSGLLGSPTP